MESRARRIVENLLESVQEPGKKPDEARDIIYRDRVIKDGTLICPHCNQEIHEKDTYSDDGGETSRHRGCNGIVRYKPPSDEEIQAMEKNWGMRYNRDARKFELGS